MAKKNDDANAKQDAINAKQAKILKQAQQSVSATGSLMGRLGIARRAGLQFKGKRDIFAVAGYVAQGEDQFADYWGMYERNPIAKRIVNKPCNTTWKTPPEVIEEEEKKTETKAEKKNGDEKDEKKVIGAIVNEKKDGTGTAFTKAFETLAKRKQLKLWSNLERVDKLASLGHFAVLMIGAKGTADTADLRKPMPKMSRPEDVLYLQPYHEGSVVITDWDNDTNSERFGLPVIYKITQLPALGRKAGQLSVHWTRIIHVAQDCLTDDVFGTPKLLAALNVLTDLDKITGATGEAYWQLADKILQVQLDPQGTPLTDDQLKELEDKLAEMVHDLRRQFIGKGAQLNWLGGDTPNVTALPDLYFSLAAVAADIPKRILFGNEAGDLASSQDQQTYFGMINERQEQFAEPQILRPLIDRLIEHGALPKPTAEDYKVVWPPLFEATETEKGNVSLQRAQMAATLTPIGGNPLELVEITDEGEIKLVPKEPGNPEDAVPEAPALPGMMPGVPPEAGEAPGAEDEKPPEDKKEPNKAAKDKESPKKKAAEQYREDQARDDHGRFEDEGGGGSSSGGSDRDHSTDDGPRYDPTESRLPQETMADLRAAGSGKPKEWEHDTDLTKGIRARNRDLLKASGDQGSLIDQTPVSIARRQALAEKMASAPAVHNKEAWIIYGPGGAGKSTVVADPVRAKEAAVVIDPDLTKNATDLPGYAGWNSPYFHEESSTIAKDALKLAMADGKNIVYPRIGANPQNELAVINKLWNAGYHVHVVLVEIPAPLSATRGMKRFSTKADSRWADPKDILAQNGKPKVSYDFIKSQRHIAVASYTHYNNDVPDQTPAILVEKIRNPQRHLGLWVSNEGQPTADQLKDLMSTMQPLVGAPSAAEDNYAVEDFYTEAALDEYLEWARRHGRLPLDRDQLEKQSLQAEVMPEDAVDGDEFVRLLKEAIAETG